MKPVGDLQTETELKTSYPQLEVRRPASAREEFKKNRDSLKTEGKVGIDNQVPWSDIITIPQVVYDLEQSHYKHHQATRPRIYK